METNDKPRFAATLTGLAGIYSKELSPEQLEVFFTALRDWPLADFERAAAQLSKTCEFFPRPFDFERLRRSGRLTPGEAWSMVLEHCRSGIYRTEGGLDGGGPIDCAVSAVGGYWAIGRTHEDELRFVERRFAEHYQDRAVADEARALPLQCRSFGVTRHGRATVLAALLPTQKEPSA